MIKVLDGCEVCMYTDNLYLKKYFILLFYNKYYILNNIIYYYISFDG